MNDEHFFKEYKRVLRMGLWSGALNAPPRIRSGQAPFMDEAHMKKFIHGCHRGYEKAQNRTLELIQIIESDSNVTSEQHERRQLLLRKVMDGIAVLLFQAKSHVLRRFILHDQPQKLSLPVVRAALAAANALNGESRWTFALVADLTTFIHVCDIVRVDFRKDHRTVSLIELKSGRVNEILVTQLDKYAPAEKSVAEIATDPGIGPKHRAQAQRMMRQKIRLAQIIEVIKTDKGTDIVSKHPIQLSKDEVKGAVYDKLLNDLLERARTEGAACGVVNYCIHIGVAYQADFNLALQNAEKAAISAIQIHLTKPPKGFSEVFSETRALVPDQELFKTSQYLSAT